MNRQLFFPLFIQGCCCCCKLKVFFFYFLIDQNVFRSDRQIKRNNKWINSPCVYVVRKWWRCVPMFRPAGSGERYRRHWFHLTPDLSQLHQGNDWYFFQFWKDYKPNILLLGSIGFLKINRYNCHSNIQLQKCPVYVFLSQFLYWLFKGTFFYHDPSSLGLNPNRCLNMK